VPLIEDHHTPQVRINGLENDQQKFGRSGRWLARCLFIWPVRVGSLSESLNRHQSRLSYVEMAIMAK
jgi:hypothetical protein